MFCLPICGCYHRSQKTEYKVYLFVTSNILMNNRMIMNLMRDLMSTKGDSMRDTNHIMNLVGRVYEKLGHGFTDFNNK